MNNIEVTYQIFDCFENIDSILKSLGFNLIENFQITDHYFTSIDKKLVKSVDYLTLLNNSCIARNFVCPDKIRSQFCYKKKTIDENGNVIYEEKTIVNVDSMDNLIKILKMANIHSWCVIENNSFIYKKGEIELNIQIVKDLGIFVELEEFDSIKNFTGNEKIERLKNICSSLNLKIGDDFNCKKSFMILHKN